MDKKNVWKKNVDRYSELENDLSTFRDLFNEAGQYPGRIQEKTYLEALSQSILTLDRHAKELTSEKMLGKSASLIHYILQTPWGAPFVGDDTLLQAAKTFSHQEWSESSLLSLLKQFDEYRNKCTLPLMKSLDQIHKEIHTVRQRAA